MYHLGKKNELADALSRREQELDLQIALKDRIRQATLLRPHQVSPEVIKDLGIDVSITDSPDYFLADEVLRQNRPPPASKRTSRGRIPTREGSSITPRKARGG